MRSVRGEGCVASRLLSTCCGGRAVRQLPITADAENTKCQWQEIPVRPQTSKKQILIRPVRQIAVARKTKYSRHKIPVTPYTRHNKVLCEVLSDVGSRNKVLFELASSTGWCNRVLCELVLSTASCNRVLCELVLNTGLCNRMLCKLAFSTGSYLVLLVFGLTVIWCYCYLSFLVFSVFGMCCSPASGVYLYCVMLMAICWYFFVRARARRIEIEKSKRAAAPPDCHFNQFAKIEATFMNQGLTRSLDESETMGRIFENNSCTNQRWARNRLKHM